MGAMEVGLLNRTGFVGRESLFHTVNEVAKKLIVDDLNSFNFNQLMEGMEIIGRFLDVDRVKIWHNEYDRDELYAVVCYEWNNEIGKTKIEVPIGFKFPYSEKPHWLKKFQQGEPINLIFSNMEPGERQTFGYYGVQTILMLPLFINGQFTGFLSVDDYKRERYFNEEEIQMFSSAGVLLTSYFNQLKQFEENAKRDRILKQLNYQLEEALGKAVRAGQAKSDFLSVMSHEMRTPLNAIIGMTEIAKNSADYKKRDDALQKIDQASKHLLGIVNNVLEMAKIEDDKIELVESEFCLREMLHKVNALVSIPMSEKRHEFTMTIDDSLQGTCIGDEQRLRQVILNLLTNARTYTPDGGKIHLGVESLGMVGETGQLEVRFSIKDNGIGISLEIQQKLFRMFEQGDSSIRRRYGGSGLGLAISQRLAHLMGGSDILIDSQVGVGSTFTFTVKLAVPAPDSFGPALCSIKESFVPNEFLGKKMLLVEDVEINREVFMSLLEGSGILFEIAENGKEALKKVADPTNKYDLVLMDVRMPEMDGLEATRRIRELNKQAKSLPIIAMTANVFTDDIIRCLEAGMDDHIGKPIDLADTLFKIRKYL